MSPSFSDGRVRAFLEVVRRLTEAQPYATAAALGREVYPQASEPVILSVRLMASRRKSLFFGRKPGRFGLLEQSNHRLSGEEPLGAMSASNLARACEKQRLVYLTTDGAVRLSRAGEALLDTDFGRPVTQAEPAG